ncbi:protein of unknown function [Modestobacter italicus]|uniref:Uncharacterized protein n=1 Tax=Modestobacter italicus (strain DSM 44449 / CECT 9708 / BC 501) TaxID=2732864 RepID=I4EUS6_MODI5|nr:protein of unknown function [Modestobacter marinus]
MFGTPLRPASVDPGLSRDTAVGADDLHPPQ